MRDSHGTCRASVKQFFAGTNKRLFRRCILEQLERRDVFAAVPFAQADPLYTTPVNTDLVIVSTGQGVVNNDYEVDNASLSASVVTSPSHGSLVSFNSNGTFTYRPTTGYSGPDTFTYKVSNGSVDSNVATVSIQVGQVFGPRTNAEEVAQPDTNFTGANILTQPLTTGLQLVYNSISEPRPVVTVETSLRSAASVPTSIEAQLTFGGVVGSAVTYSTSGLSAGTPLRFTLQVDGSSLSTGYYDYTLTLTAKYSGSADVVQTFTGSQAIVNRSSSEFGRGWWLDNLSRLVTSGSGALLVEGGGDTYWFKKNGSVWDSAPGDLSTNALTQSGSNYLLTSKYGDVKTFNSSGYLVSSADSNGNTWSYTYNGSNQLTTITDPYSRTITLAYSSGYVSSVTDIASHVVSLSYSSGKLTSATLPDPDAGGALTSPVYSYGYDGTTSLLNSFTDPRSNVTTYSYDSTSRRLNLVTHPDSTTLELVPIQTFGLKTGTGNSLVSPSSVIGTLTDEEGFDWTFKVDRYGNTIESTNPLGSVTTVLRDQNGRALKVTDADPDAAGPLTSPITRYGYNAAGDLLKVVNPDLTTLIYTYSTTLHRTLTATDEVGRVTTMTYDAYGNMLTSVDNAGNTWTYTYTGRGFVDTETTPDPDGGGALSAYVTDYDYDSNGRLVTVTLPNSATITYTYNSADLVLTATNELGYVTSYAYDALNRLTSVTEPDPDGAGALTAPVTSYQYNALGLVTKIINPLSYETSFTYNNRNWRTVITHPDPDGAGSLSSPTETFTFDDTGRLVSYVDSMKAPSETNTFEYDDAGQLISESQLSAAQLDVNTYDALGRLISKANDSVEVIYEYDIRSRVTNITKTAVLGTATTQSTDFTYNQASQLTSRTDTNNHTTNWYYTSAGWLNSEVLPDTDGSGPMFGPTTTYGYDALGNLTAVTDANGNITDYEVNFRGQRTKETLPDPDGAGALSTPITSYSYNNAGWMTSVTDPLSRVTSFTYDHLGNVLTRTLPDPDGAGALSAPVFTYAYNANRQVTSLTDPRGGVTATTYDGLGRVLTITAPDPDGAGALTSAVTTYGYGSRGISSITDALSNSTTFGYDSNGNLTTSTDALGKVTTRVFNDRGLLTSISTPDPDGAGIQTASTTTFAYDAFDRVASKTDANSGDTYYDYDGVGNLLSLTDPNGNVTSWSYDALDRVTIETNELSDSRSFVFDAMGNLTRKTDRNERVTQYDYDQINRLVAEKWMTGTSSTPDIDIQTTQGGGVGNEIQAVGFEVDFGSFSGTFTLSFGGNTTSSISTSASAATVKSALEGLAGIGSGNVSVTKTSTSTSALWTVEFIGSLAASNKSQITIDTSGVFAFGTLTETESTLANGHGAQDEIQTVTLSNATGGTFRLAYKGQTTVPLAYNSSAATVDAALEALSTLGASAVTVSLSGSVYTITFGGGIVDGTDVNPLQGDVSTATYGTVSRTIATAYDAASQTTQITDPSATIDYTRDNLGRATSIVSTISGLTPAITFEQAFNAAGDRTQLKAKVASTNDFKTDFTFDTLGRVTDILQQSNSGNAVASKHVVLAYNKLNQFTSINRYESTGTSSQVASTDYVYDTLNRVTDIDHKQGSTVLASYDYTYDYASRISSVNSSQDGVTNYSYDVTNQLSAADHTGQADESFMYDANGNRSDFLFYTVGPNNQITTDGTNNYEYDDEGNRTKKTDTNTGDYTTYTWDYRNRLTAVKDYNSSNVLQKETTYDYDAFNRLIRSTYDADGAGAGAATDKFWAFDDGINPILEFDGSTSSDVSHRYLWGPIVDQLLADEQVSSTAAAGNVLWALGDSLNTIRDIADLSGSTTSVTNHRRFGTFGTLVSESNAAVDLIFAFTGKLFDENTKLQNNLNRWYDPAIGQWISEDPIGFAANDENIKRYVGNESTRNTDPTGLIDGYWDPKTGQYKRGAPPQEPDTFFGKVLHLFLEPDIDVLNPLGSMAAKPVKPILGGALRGIGSIFGGVRRTLPPWLGGIPAIPPQNVPTRIIPKNPWPNPNRTLLDPLPPKIGTPAKPPKKGHADPHSPDPNASGPHTVLGTKTDPKKSPEPYLTGIEYDANGMPVRKIDHTNHGRGDHTNPHEHPYDPETDDFGPKVNLPKAK